MTQTCKHPTTPRAAARRRAPVDALLDPELFKALSDPTRLALLGCLVKCARPCSVSEIAQCCAVDFSVVSRHLALLARAGVLDVVRRGRVVSYAVRFEAVVTRLRALADAIDAWRPLADATARGGCCGP